ncbi:sulfatase [Halobellus salinus]|nr:sulfatase [Halobellus salinus]SMP18081.1 Arylsulfatase A [Halobellus salinus]
MEQAPNVLLIVLDATRKDHLSCYGYDRPTTPTIDSIAADGTRFEQAIATSAWTPPTHASMFTGCYPSRHGVFNSQLSLTYDGPTIAELLSENGYRTLGFSNSYHTSTERNFHRGFDYYHDVFELPRFLGKMYDPSLDFLRFLPNYFLKNYDISDLQLRRLKTQLTQTEEPFFGFINLNAAHSPYDPPSKFRKQFEAYFDQWDTVDKETAKHIATGNGRDYTLGDNKVTETEWNLVKCWYDGEIRYTDYLLSKFIDFFKNEGLYDDTLLIVAADHGEHFGEHNLVYHAYSLFEELVNVPLIVKWPDGHHGHNRALPSEISNNLVSLTDIAPTICEWAGIETPSGMQGRDLTIGSGRDAVFAEYDRPQPPKRDQMLETYNGFEEYDRGLQAIRTTEYKLIRTTTGEETLYRIQNGDETAVENEKVQHQLSQRMNERLDEIPDGEHDEDLDDHVKDHLEKMGYI